MLPRCRTLPQSGMWARSRCRTGCEVSRMGDSTGTWCVDEFKVMIPSWRTLIHSALLPSQVDSLKRIRQIPSTNVLIRDVTGLDTSRDRKSSWAIPPIIVYRVIAGCCDALRFMLRETSLGSRFFSSLRLLDVTWFYTFPTSAWMSVCRWLTIPYVTRQAGGETKEESQGEARNSSQEIVVKSVLDSEGTDCYSIE